MNDLTEKFVVAKKDIRALNNILIDGIKGAMVTIEDTIGACGHLPKIVRANVDFQLISKGGTICE